MNGSYPRLIVGKNDRKEELFMKILLALLMIAITSPTLAQEVDDQSNDINLTISVKREESQGLIFTMPAYLSVPTMATHTFNGVEVKKAAVRSSSRGLSGPSRYTAVVLHLDDSLEVIHQSTECGTIRYRGPLVARGQSVKKHSDNGTCLLDVERVGSRQ